jgi:hypothetical protein
MGKVGAIWRGNVILTSISCQDQDMFMAVGSLWISPTVAALGEPRGRLASLCGLGLPQEPIVRKRCSGPTFRSGPVRGLMPGHERSI